MKFTASFPPADALLAFLAGINYRKLASQLVMLVATVAAITVAVSLFTWKHAKRFWQEHGDSITLHFELFVEKVEWAIQWAYDAGVTFRPTANRWAARAADWLYYTLAEGELPRIRFTN